MWSVQDPVTLFGAWGPCKSGWEEVSQRSSLSIDGGPVQENVVRVTHIFRREKGQWKIVHRHGDFPPPDQSPPEDTGGYRPPAG